MPVLERTFVYDNGASMKNKGYDFAVRRITQHLHEHYRKYGNEGYILLFDFSKFFDNVSHEVVKAILHKEFTDERLLALTEHFIDAFGDKGMGWAVRSVRCWPSPLQTVLTTTSRRFCRCAAMAGIWTTAT